MKNQTILPLILMVVALGVGFMIGRFTAPIQSDNTNAVTKTVTTNPESSQTNEMGEESSDTTISANSLTPEQRQLLTSLGINAEEINVTPEMIACAEAKLGVERMEEIKGGATPSFSEGISLVACYK